MILAITVSPLQNLAPPLNSAFSVSGIFFVNGFNLSIATFVVIAPFLRFKRGLKSIKSAARIVLHSDIIPNRPQSFPNLRFQLMRLSEKLRQFSGQSPHLLFKRFTVIFLLLNSDIASRRTMKSCPANPCKGGFAASGAVLPALAHPRRASSPMSALTSSTTSTKRRDASSKRVSAASATCAALRICR